MHSLVSLLQLFLLPIEQMLGFVEFPRYCGDRLEHAFVLKVHHPARIQPEPDLLRPLAHLEDVSVLVIVQVRQSVTVLLSKLESVLLNLLGVCEVAAVFGVFVVLHGVVRGNSVAGNGDSFHEELVRRNHGSHAVCAVELGRDSTSASLYCRDRLLARVLHLDVELGLEHVRTLQQEHQ